MSGEALQDLSFSYKPFSNHLLELLLEHVRGILEICRVAIVIGGGNFWRGTNSQDDPILKRTSSDQMGMLATIMNGILLRDFFDYHRVPCMLYSSIQINGIAHAFDGAIARKDMENRLVILAGGTGSAYFTTDTCAVLRALELECDAVIKMTKVSGIYTKDPKKHEDARFLPTLSFDDVSVNRYSVMDQSAFILAKEHQLPIYVTSFFDNNALRNIVTNQPGEYSIVGKNPFKKS